MTCLAAGTVQADQVADVRGAFPAPPVEYSTAPLWVWNDRMTEEQVRQCLRDLASQHVIQAFVHPRPGLMTPYLSEEWMSLWKVALDEAEKLGMNVWIYDENSYPSGFAGGHVPDLMPESRAQGIDFEEVTDVPLPLDPDVLAVFAMTETEFTDVMPAPGSSPTFATGKYVLVKRTWDQQSGWFGGKTFVDLLLPGVTEKFLEVTLDPYKKAFGDEFGKRMPGSFTDEPHLAHSKGLHWTPDLPEAFQKRWGYDLMKVLPSLQFDLGDWKRVRHDYYQLINELFIERWGKPYYEYCERAGIAFTGHYWEHEWPNTRSVPDNMAMGAWQHVPGIDILFNQYNEGVHAQVGNVRAVMELASVANQLGRKHRLCETYGGGGWDLRFEDMKRIGDWVSVLGITFVNQHLTHSTLRGARKGDYPQTFSYHATWWDAYHVQADYLARLSLALSNGAQINDVLVIEPTSTVWMYQGPNKEYREKVGEAFQALVTELAKANVEFDIGCEYIMENWGSVKQGKLHVGERAYSLVVLPPFTENLNGPTMTLLEKYLKQGGQVLCMDKEAPAMVDAQASDRPRAASASKTWFTQENAPWPAPALQSRQCANVSGFCMKLPEDNKGIVYHQRRQFEDGQLLFIVNTSMDAEAKGDFRCAGVGGVEQWNIETGETGLTYPFEKRDGGVTGSFSLAPCGSLLLYLTKEEKDAVPTTAPPAFTAVAASGDLTVKRTSPNVLTLDYVDVTAGGETRTEQYFYAAAEFVFQKHGLERNPWDHAVQFKDDLISKTFPPESGFEATYHFTIEGEVPKPLYAVVERTDLYAITCNGQAVTPSPGEWWLDRAFGVIDISACVQPGENTLTIKATPFTMFHELERAYLLGDFNVVPREKGFAVAANAPMTVGPWNAQGSPLYGAGVAYTQTFDAANPSGRYEVALGDWLGSVAKVRVNGEEAGYIYHRPFTCDVTKLIKAGANTVEVEVIGTPKNTLGPHHGEPPLGIAAPDMFRKGPMPGPPAGASYSTIGYGLFAPFELRAAAAL